MKKTRMLIFFPVDTGRKLNVRKTLRRRPGRLLNVFYAFSLRPVSTGFMLPYEIQFLQILKLLIFYSKNVRTLYMVDCIFGNRV